MSTLNDADLSGGKPANTDASATTMSSNNANIFGAPSAGADSSFALLQQVQTILLENNQAKARMVELENQVASFQKEREELVCKMEESEKSSKQSIESIQQQLSQKEQEWAEKFETQENNHDSSLKNLQEKLDDWESQHQDWTARENEYQKNIGNLEGSKSQLETNVQQLETDLEASKAEASQLRTEQADNLKNHEATIDELNSQIESLQKDLEAQGLQKEQDNHNHQEQENELKQTLDELRATIQEKETLVQSLEGTIDEMRLEASELKQDHQTQVENMEAAIANLELENVVQSKQGEDYQTQIEKLKQEMDSLHSVFLKQQKEAEEKENEAEQRKLDEEQQQQRQEEQDDSKWQELVQSLQIQVQAQTNIAETKSQELENSKSQNMQLRVQLQVLTQQKEQLEKNWTETKEKLKVLEDQPAQQSETTENDDSPQEEQVKQDQVISSLTEENERLQERIVQMEAHLVLGNARGFDHSESKEDYNDHANTNNDDTIAQLQQRIMHLVEEKLILQTAVETLEHQFMESNLLERNASSRQLQVKQRSPAATMKDYLQKGQKQLKEKLEQEPPPKIVVDENTKQADIIRLTMQRQQSQKLSRRISHTVLGTPTVPKPVQQIDVKAAERMFLEQQQKEELLKKAKKNSKQTNLSNVPRTRSTEIGRSSWIQSRDLGLGAEDTASNENNKTTNLPGYTASNQHGFVKSAMRSSSTSPASKKEKTTTWTRIRDSISGPKSGEKGSKTGPTNNADDFSLWVQELNHEQQQSRGGTEESKQNEEFKNLSEPASMLDSLPPAPSSPLTSTAGRYAVQTIDHLLHEGVDAMVEGIGNKNSKPQQAREPQTYRVLDPTQKKPKEVPKTKDEKPVIGEGHTIDQSSLLGFYVHKQKEAANATTIGYLSNMIYGDPEEDEAKIQRKLLKRQLARKKKQEEKEREQLEKEVKASIRPKVANKEPKTIFSSFI